MQRRCDARCCAASTAVALGLACRLGVRRPGGFHLKCSGRGRRRHSALLLTVVARLACRLGRGDHGPLAHVLDELHGVLPPCMPVCPCAESAMHGSCSACPSDSPSPCTISVFQALAEALTTSKGMVGRRLLTCLDLPKVVRSKCDNVVDSATTAANTAKTNAIRLRDDAIDSRDDAIRLKNDAIRLKNDAISNFTRAVKDAAAAAAEATRKFTELGDGIQCALPLQNPRAHNRRANGLAR